VVFAIEPVQKSCDCVEGKGIMLGLTAPNASFYTVLRLPQPSLGGQNRFLNF
jgi:hypothetical protein